MAADPEDPPPVKYGLKPKVFPVANDRATPPAPTVHEVLQQNLARQQAAEPAVLPHLKDRRTKRRRDYWVLMLGGNALGGVCAWLLPLNPVVFIYLLAFIIVFNVSLLWVMFHVMDKY